MKKIFFTLLLFVTAFRMQAQIAPAFTNHLQYMMDSLCKKYKIKGASMAVLIPNGGIWKGAYGEANPGEPMTTDAIMGIGSNTKTFTSSVMLRLQENGQINLDDTIGTWFPGLNNVNEQITVRQLLNHTSGLYNYTDTSAFGAMVSSDFTHVFQPEDMLPLIGPPHFAAGTSWEYSNTNYLLAGLIIKKITGHTYESVVRNTILNAQNLNNTYLYPSETLPSPMPRPWSVNFSGSIMEDLVASYGYSNEAFLSAASAAGEIVSTAEDNVKFWNALMTGKIISSSSLSQMKTFRDIGGGASYGLGLFRYSPINGHVVYSHGGTCIGYLNENLTDSANGICITIITNSDSFDNDKLLSKILMPVHKYLLTLPPAGIQVVNNNLSVKMYPNPATNVLHLSTNVTGELNFALTDITGHSVLNTSVFANSTISLPQLASGIYIASVSKDGQPLSTQKIFIQ